LCRFFQKHISFLVDEAKQIHTIKPADRWKSHVSPSTDHNKHHDQLNILGICSAGSTVALVSYVLITYKHSKFLSIQGFMLVLALTALKNNLLVKVSVNIGHFRTKWELSCLGDIGFIKHQSPFLYVPDIGPFHIEEHDKQC
jgi:hypothetical protein